MTERALAVVAHPDDETLGCGATLAKHAAAGDPVSIVVLADGVGSRGNSPAAFKDRHAACRTACKFLGTDDVWLHQYADNQLDGLTLLHLVKQIEIHIARFKPTVVYTHHNGDLNVDHRQTYDAVRVACRPQPSCTVKTLLHFEVPCSSAWGGQFQPNYFVDATDTLEKKLMAAACYVSELREYPHPRSQEGIRNLALMRGASVGVPFAEAFMVGRISA